MYLHQQYVLTRAACADVSDIYLHQQYVLTLEDEVASADILALLALLSEAAGRFLLFIILP